MRSIIREDEGIRPQAFTAISRRLTLISMMHGIMSHQMHAGAARHGLISGARQHKEVAK
jgi:hypothetical protein